MALARQRRGARAQPLGRWKAPIGSTSAPHSKAPGARGRRRHTPKHGYIRLDGANLSDPIVQETEGFMHVFDGGAIRFMLLKRLQRVVCLSPGRVRSMR